MERRAGWINAGRVAWGAVASPGRPVASPGMRVCRRSASSHVALETADDCAINAARPASCMAR